VHLVSLYLLYFFVYSFLGWVHEVLFSLTFAHKLRNPGFLTGPILPIYGIGAVAIVIVAPYIENPFLVFVASAVIATVIEYVGHLVLELIFHLRLWDYSARRFNLQGRVCLENSLGFGVLALLVVYVVHPFIARIFEPLSTTVAIAVAFTLLGILLVDLASSVWTLVKLRPEVDAIRGSFGELQQRAEARIVQLQQARERLQLQLDRTQLNVRTVHRGNITRLRKAFPDALAGRPPRSQRAPRR
jgi:uncharacterized membrane protein